MSIKNIAWLQRCLALLLLLLINIKVFAQIATDGTLGSSAQDLTGPDYTISEDLGSRVGTNLFHSFSAFNIDTGESATFTGSESIENIISRVTGNEASTINGLLRSDIDSARFYFINPNGVLFGPNATLDVSGAFHVSTGDYVGFGAESRFYASSLKSSVLSTAAPSAFGFLDDTVGAIEANGAILEVNRGQAFSIVGGNITIDNTTLEAEKGQANLVSVISSGEVILSEGEIKVDQALVSAEDLGTVKLDNASEVNVDGEGGGLIFIFGGSLSIDNSSRLLADTLGDVDSRGGININIADQIFIGEESAISATTIGAGTGGALSISAQSLEISNGSVFVEVRSTGSGGDIIIDVGQGININSNAFISMANFGEAVGGELSISAQSLEISNGSVFANVDSTGAGGDITIDASQDISITDTVISTTTVGAGTGGALSISAQSLEISNSLVSAEVRSTGSGGGITIDASQDISIHSKGRISTTTDGAGTGGALSISAQSLEISNSSVSAEVRSTGSGGNITINASQDINIDSDGLISSGISEFDGFIEGIDSSGDGGNISLGANNLTLTNGSEINSSTRSNSQGGDITIKVQETIRLSGDNAALASEQQMISFSETVISATTSGQRDDAGNAGTINLYAKDLFIEDFVAITTSTLNSGNAGNINLEVTDTLVLDGSNVVNNEALSYGLVSSSISTQGNAGNAGAISIAANTINIVNNRISTSTLGHGNAGSIIIGQAAQLTLDDNNRLIVDESIMLVNPEQAVSRLTLNDSSIESASIATSRIPGKAGTIKIAVTDAVRLENNAILNTSEANSPTEISQLDTETGSILIQAPNLVYLLDSQITTSVARGGSPGGNISIDPQLVVLNNSSITANAFGGTGGNISIVADNYFQSSDSIVSASSQRGIDGQINISSPDTDFTTGLIQLPENYLHSQSWEVEKCAARLGGIGSSFIQTGRHGIPLLSEDLRPPNLFGVKEKERWQRENSTLATAHEYFVKGHYQETVTLLQGYLLGNSNTSEDKEPFTDSTASDSNRLAVLFLLAQAYQYQGRYDLSEQTLLQAQQRILSLDDLFWEVAIQITLSDFYLATQHTDEAEQLGFQAIENVFSSNQLELTAAALHNWGNISLVSGDSKEAMYAYEQSLALYEESQDHDGSLRILANRIDVALAEADFTLALTLLEKAFSQTKHIQEDHQRVWHLLALASRAQQLSEHKQLDSQTRQAVVSQQKDILLKTSNLARTLDSPLLQSQITGLLGAFYLAQGAPEQSLSFIQKALFLAEQQGQHPELIYRWQWQMGRVFAQLNQLKAAQNAYQQAVTTLNPIRSQFFNGYRKDANALFREQIKLVYYELAAIHLRQAQLTEQDDQRQTHLQQTRLVIEEMKSAELQDLFQDECATALNNKAKNIDHVAERTAVLYPVVLENEIVMLVNLPEGIQQYTTAVTREQFDQTVHRFRIHLQTLSHRRFLIQAQQIYDWLIRPLEADLQAARIDTLIIVPDGTLSMIPLSALHDGQDFLIENYALAITPGLALTDPQPVSRDNLESLLAGISESVQDYSALPGVDKELSNIYECLGSAEIFINESYQEENVRKALASKDYRLLHIATHGEFDSDPDKSYILTYEDKFDLDELESLLKLGQFREDPLELLTLSACRTAVGNERAALGLAGVAVKSGVRSAIATLWFVDDEATMRTITEFYRQFHENEHYSKARALQVAQKMLMSEKRFSHPAYWAPFLVIGNWL